MKTSIQATFLSDLKQISRTLFIGVAFMAGSFSCSDSALEEISARRLVRQNSSEIQPEASDALSASSNTSITETTFTATAQVAYCYGENISFTGTIQNRVTKNTDASGEVHFTRSFYTKDMSAKGVVSQTEFDVLGGAEMFAVKDAVLPSGSLDLSKSLVESDIVIHEGTLVFQNREDGSIVVARHIIRKVPGQEVPVNQWECRGI
jgi:hypothetical protein